MNARSLVPMLVVGVAVAAAHAQIVHGQVDAVGFQTSAGSVLREGRWFPIAVSLASQGSQIFSGELRVEGIDLDGDRVAFTQAQVTVTPDVGAPKRFWCYVVANAVNELARNVDVINQDGALVAQLPMPVQPPYPILNDDLLVLDISYPQVTALNALQTPPAQWSPGQRTEGIRRFYRNVVVARMSTGDLPDRWWGLEAVDVIVWDRPAPAALSIAQRDALLDWVRNGGQLVVGVGATWSALRKSDLAPIMPFEGEGPTAEVRRLRAFHDRMALPAWEKPEFHNPIVVTTASPASEAFRTQGDYGGINLITMRLVGSGRVVATAAALRDLTSVPIDLEKFFGALFDLNAYTEKFKERQLEASQYGIPNLTNVYDDVVLPIGFGAATALRGLTALVFVAAYIAIATLASWWWLRGRVLTHLSWTVFAAFAVVASLLSLGTVSALRGFSRGVQAVSVLDLEAGSTTARGACLFGYRSAIRQRVELTLPGEGNFLRPLARHPNPSRVSFYVTPARYAAVPAQARLGDVLMRATLKQMEGFWHGELEGTIRGRLEPSRRTGRLSAASWIANDLNVDVAGGYLLFIDPRQEDGALGVPWRAAGLTTLYELPESAGGRPDVTVVPPAVNILAVRVPEIEAGKQVSGLGKADYDRLDEKLKSWNPLAEGLTRSRMPDVRTLWQEQQAWADNGYFAALRAELSGTVRAMLLASTRNYHLHNRSDDFDSVGTPVSTDGLPDLDITHWLLRGQAVLICWANDPGPAQLHRNGKPLKSYGGLAFYRVRIPIHYEGAPPLRGIQP